MKSRIISLALGAALVSLFAGCGKQETAAPAAAAPAPTVATAPAAKDMKATAEKMADQGKQSVTQAAASLSADMTKQAQGAIDKAKSLIGEKKYQDALTSLQALAASKLSPEHKKTVDDLIAQVQKLMSSDMGKAVQGVMKK